MRHAKKSKRLGGSTSHRNVILSNIAAEIFKHERVKTTELRAKEVRPIIDKIITLAKKGDLHSRRQIRSIIDDKEAVVKVFAEIVERYGDREGGYTRIYKVGSRKGDNASLVLIELV